MPIYEYVCQKCGHHLEVMQKMSDKPLTRCPECRGKLEKVISQTSFQLKGSGWYVSDYGKGGAKGTDKTAKSDSAKTDKTEKGTKSDAASDSSKSDKPGKKEATAGPTPSSSGSTAKSD